MKNDAECINIVAGSGDPGETLRSHIGDGSHFRACCGQGWTGSHTLDTGYAKIDERSEEHTSELQSQSNLVCRLLLEKKKNSAQHANTTTCSLLFQNYSILRCSQHHCI